MKATDLLSTAQETSPCTKIAFGTAQICSRVQSHDISQVFLFVMPSKICHRDRSFERTDACPPFASIHFQVGVCFRLQKDANHLGKVVTALEHILIAPVGSRRAGSPESCFAAPS